MKLSPALSLITILAVFSSCTHYRPLRFIGKDKPSQKAIRSCTHHFFTIPGTPENTSYQRLTYEQGLLEKDVHSFDFSTTYIFYPIFYRTCVIANLTERGAKKLKDSSLHLSKGAASKPVGYYMDGDHKITTLKGCNRLGKLSQIDCKRAVSRKK